MGISAAGMLSGLDVNGLVTSLMEVEKQPLANLQAKQASFNSKLSAFGTLKSAVSTFQAAVKALSGDALRALTTTSTKADAIGVSATKDGGAAAGSYSIEVSKLAQSDKLVSSGIATDAKFLGPGSMEITIGGKPTTVNLTDATLASVSSAINKANAGVTATILNDGTQDRLVITGNQSGSANGVTIAATGSLARFDSTPPPVTVPPTEPNMARTQTAQNAEMTIDGIAVSKPSNTVIDAIKGVTLNLAQTNIGSPATITLAKDAATVTKSVTAFVDAYNALATAVNKQTAYNAATKTGAVLNGDAGARSILGSIRSELGKAVSGATGLSSLSDIGIAFQRDGTLKLEKPAKLETAIATNFEGVSNLFNSASGVATRLAKVTEDMLGSKGVFKSRTDGLNASIKGLEKSSDRMELQLAQTEKRYRTQFTSLDSMMVNMQSMSSYMTQQLAALAANSGY
ncbi:flagellar filament capping protein FliD [Massilia litorea]|jgi:flagellar hook-associated protein 2|uniref:Flagellar hook-associated protein 2 n=1 Tax=Massilia litorea TaxID=2769491 RepID=A0A7L9U9M9_9BURK|nr:flagellar filament capping protein FliD [Massilia litorea]QOL51753.1 flagellar filament capping protein FliD [Massilia litorea]